VFGALVDQISAPVGSRRSTILHTGRRPLSLRAVFRKLWASSTARLTNLAYANHMRSQAAAVIRDRGLRFWAGTRLPEGKDLLPHANFEPG
jgi:hypothetical protein